MERLGLPYGDNETYSYDCDCKYSIDIYKIYLEPWVGAHPRFYVFAYIQTFK